MPLAEATAGRLLQRGPRAMVQMCPIFPNVTKEQSCSWQRLRLAGMPALSASRSAVHPSLSSVRIFRDSGFKASRAGPLIRIDC